MIFLWKNRQPLYSLGDFVYEKLDIIEHKYNIPISQELISVGEVKAIMCEIHIENSRKGEYLQNERNGKFFRLRR